MAVYRPPRCARIRTFVKEGCHCADCCAHRERQRRADQDRVRAKWMFWLGAEAETLSFA